MLRRSVNLRCPPENPETQFYYGRLPRLSTSMFAFFQDKWESRMDWVQRGNPPQRGCAVRNKGPMAGIAIPSLALIDVPVTLLSDSALPPLGKPRQATIQPWEIATASDFSTDNVQMTLLTLKETVEVRFYGARAGWQTAEINRSWVIKESVIRFRERAGL